jgi:magnesium transporter
MRNGIALIHHSSFCILHFPPPALFRVSAGRRILSPMSSKPSRRKRRRVRIHRHTQVGAPPGTLVADPAAHAPQVYVMAYGPDKFVEQEIKSDHAHVIAPLLSEFPVVWVNVDGLGDTGVIQSIGKLFGLHPLALEDVVHVHQRAKLEEYGDHLFIVSRMPGSDGRLDTEQLSLFLGKRYVLTFQDRPGDCLDTVRERIRRSRGLLRSLGPDYLTYVLLDATIDAYFPVLEKLSERIDDLEDYILSLSDDNTVAMIHEVKSDLLMLRRAVWPHREMFNAMIRETTDLVDEETRVHLRDCYDHTAQLIDLIEVYREVTADLRDMYLSMVNQRTNEVMKVLTIIATVFMPLTFIVGIYGMNFDPDSSPWNMPELRAYYGYPVTLASCVVVTIGMLIYFRKKKWIGKWLDRRRAEEAAAES